MTTVFPTERRVLNFGDAARPMTGMRHAPASLKPGGPAALLCCPMGHEAIRAHRVFVVLADRLARAGVCALRFDYYATGDSAGDEVEGELEGWTRDIVTADGALRSIARPSTVTWIGLQLGATLAALAANRAPNAPDTTLLWDPVVDGPAYLRRLAIADHEAVMQGFSGNARRYRDLAGAPVQDDPPEALGLELSATLRDQLRSVDAAAVARVRTDRLIVATAYPVPRLVEAIDTARREGVAAELRRLRTAIDWMSSDAAGHTIAPGEIVDLMVPEACRSCA
jgi:alpha/beta superfamily hydrolase